MSLLMKVLLFLSLYNIVASVLYGIFVGIPNHIRYAKETFSPLFVCEEDIEEQENEEVVKMTGLIEEYAKKYAKEREIQTCIETLLEFTNMSEKDIIERIIQKYNLTFEEAESYYMTCKADIQDE